MLVVGNPFYVYPNITLLKILAVFAQEHHTHSRLNLAQAVYDAMTKLAQLQNNLSTKNIKSFQRNFQELVLGVLSAFLSTNQKDLETNEILIAIAA